jgi:cellobiose phosphorylase
VSSEFEGISVRFRTFVPAKGLREVWTVEITNHNDIATELSVVPMVKMELMGYTGPRFCNSPLQSYVTTFEEELNGTYFETRNPNTKGKPYDAVLAASGKVDFYSGCDRATLAAPQTLYYPYALLNGKNLDSSVSMSGIPFMALQCIASIEPGETKRMDFVLGTCCNKEEAKEIVSVLSSETAVEAEFEKALAKIDKRRKGVRIKTPDDKINYFVNTWLKKGMEYCLRKKDATRDNLQFAFGLTMSEPEVTKDTIRLAMSYQYKDGHTV